MKQHPGQRIAIAFAAGEHADRFEDIISGEQEAPEQVAQLGCARKRRNRLQIFEYSPLDIEFLVLVLRKIVRLDIVSKLNAPAGCWLNATKKLDQRGFSGAVYAYECNAISALHHEADVAEDM